MILGVRIVTVKELPFGEVYDMFTDLVTDVDKAMVLVVAVESVGGWQARVGWPAEEWLKDSTNQEHNYFSRRDVGSESVSKYGLTLPEQEGRYLFEIGKEYDAVH